MALQYGKVHHPCEKEDSFPLFLSLPTSQFNPTQLSPCPFVKRKSHFQYKSFSFLLLLRALLLNPTTTRKFRTKGYDELAQMEYLLFKEGEERKMEEMMNPTSTRSPSNQPSSSSPPWKLYHNPLYTHQEPLLPTYNYNLCGHWNCTLSNCSNISSAVSSSLSDLSFIMETTTNSMKMELEEARAQIIELKAELEFEHRLRKKMECLTNRMANDLEEERRGREATERVCEELGNRVSCHKAEIDRIRKEMDEERKMLRVAEVFREERVQMKLTDAKIFYEQKLLRLEQTDQGDEEKPIIFLEENVGEIGGKCGGSIVCATAVQRRVTPEPENPHIKRGIKGSVEFQTVVRALCANKSNRHLGGNYKLECQKAQLKILMKQRSPLQTNSLVIS